MLEKYRNNHHCPASRFKDMTSVYKKIPVILRRCSLRAETHDGKCVCVGLGMWKRSHNVKLPVILRRSRNRFRCPTSPRCCPLGRRSEKTMLSLCPAWKGLYWERREKQDCNDVFQTCQFQRCLQQSTAHLSLLAAKLTDVVGTENDWISWRF